MFPLRISTLVLSCAFSLHLMPTLNGQEKEDATKPKLGAASTLLRGTVVDEQGDPVAGAIIESKAREEEQSFRVTANAKGAFVHRVQAVGHYGIPMLVRSPDGELSSFVSGYDYELSSAKPFKFVVRPERTTTVRVVDEKDQPIEGAAIRVDAEFVVLASGTTNSSGQATLTFPADAKVDWILAKKVKQGFDYYENYDAFPTQERLDVPASVQLKLNGAVSVRVTTLDSAKKPIEGVTLTPWTIKKKGKLSYYNCGGPHETKSGENGSCQFDWIPSDLEKGVTFLGYSQQYFTPGNPRYDPGNPGNTDLTMDMLQTCKVTGKVTYPDGTPAVGVRLQGEGRGDTNHYFRGHTSTKDDGTYELNIYPDQDTMISVVEDDVSAASVNDILLAEGKDRKGVNFELTTGTLITGIISSGKDKKPVEGQTATLIQLGDNRAKLVRWSTTNIDGRYRFRAGPGVFTLTLAGGKSMNVTVEDESELTFDKNLARLPRGTLTGLVVDAVGKPQAGAIVLGESIGEPGHAGLATTKTGEDGRFKTERWNDKMILFAINEQEGLVGHAVISADDRAVKLTVHPGATVSGQVLDSNSSPLANMRVHLHMDPSDGQTGVDRFVRTDQQGRYAFRSVPKNASHSIHVYDETDTNNESRDFKVGQSDDEVQIKPIMMKGNSDDD
ncbi:MAG: hypothetical protein WBD20_05985 [Pirellulaceae bacterium]